MNRAMVGTNLGVLNRLLQTMGLFVVVLVILEES